MPAQVQPILFTKFKGTTAPVLGFLDGSGCSPTLMGSTFSSLELGNVRDRTHSLARRFRGDVYCVLNNQIWKSVGGTATPVSVYTFANALNQPGAHLGLYVRLINGVPTLCTAYNVTGTATWNIVKSIDGSTWATEVAVPGVCQTTTGPVGRQGVFRNQIHFLTQGNTHVSFIDLETGTGGQNVTTGLATPPASVDFCVYKGIFWMLTYSAAGAHWALCALNGTAWVQQAVLIDPAGYTGPQSPEAFYTADTALFADGNGNLVAIAPWSGTFRSGYGAISIVADSTGVITSQADITATILPTSWVIDNIGDNSFPGTDVRLWIYQEMDSIPGTVTTHVYVALSLGDGIALAYYLFNGIAAKIGIAGNANDSGGSATYALPHSKLQNFGAGSLNLWDPTSPEIYFTMNPIQSLNAEAIQFTIHNPGNTLTPTKNVKGYFIDKVGEMESNVPMHFSACRKVSGAGAVPTLSNDHLTIQGCSGDGTVYEGSWDLVTDGVVALDRVGVVLDAR